MNFRKHIHVFGRTLVKYEVPQMLIDEINKLYDTHQKDLADSGAKLAGRLANEKTMNSVLKDSLPLATLDLFVLDYYKTLASLNQIPVAYEKYSIIECWVNEMTSGEYNPIHIHNDGLGSSSILFLKIPEFKKEGVKHPHKFRDGQTGFIYENVTTMVQPKVGDLYLFEAKHQHFVNPFKSDTPRRSLSFNFTPSIDGSKKENVKHLMK